MKHAILGICTLLIVVRASCAPAPATPSLLSDPYQIYARTRAAWAAQRYPDFVAYTIRVDVDERGVPKTKHYHAIYEQPNGKIHVAAVSDEEHDNPPNPSGVTIHLLPKRQHIAIMDKRVGNPGEAVDYLGIPMLAPNYSFGLGLPLPGDAAANDDLVAQIREQYHDPMPPVKVQQVNGSGQLKSIASVTVIAHQYKIALTGIEKIDGTDCYHLVMQPATEPQRYRLRELWIETQTYETRRLLTAYNFTNSRVPWLVTFADIGGARYISSEVAQAPVGVGDHRYQHASISFENVAPAQRPSSYVESMFVTSQNVMMEPPY